MYSIKQYFKKLQIKLILYKSIYNKIPSIIYYYTDVNI